ncbi:Glutaconate CoA-transferase subunit A [Symmachiella macrocystis]|uniref:Glutaconate CoA-transferase subunit A n=1 Tax=Symmachiella macrocystis TaxID=2527985 RepID=A0A5C6B649_9PLAN|nr:CoA-transferase [Symmachiella macrocystis]TWU06736.1 Glutaconate CoA-transferase subunit A [Symmachiella macrocystis]
MTQINPLPRGNGPLFLDCDPDAARDAFAEKSKQLQSKVMSVPEAVRQFVNDGDYLAAGGFGGDRIATALLHEIVRQRKQGLGLAGHTATHDFQILCAGNQTGRGQLLNRVDAAYIVGLEARGLSPHARRVVENGEVQLCEWTNYTLALRFQAAAMGLPYLPARSMLGTDTFQQSAAQTIICPFTGKKLAAIPALWPDIAVIHVHEADCYGNCRIRGTSVTDYHLARAAKKLIISCERLIDTEEIRRDPTATQIPFYCVDAVCEVPYGSFPANMPYEYFSDETHLCEWLTTERDPQQYQKYLHHYIFDVADFHEYLSRCGGLPRLQELRRQELFPAD